MTDTTTTRPKLTLVESYEQRDTFLTMQERMLRNDVRRIFLGGRTSALGTPERAAENHAAAVKAAELVTQHCERWEPLYNSQLLP